MSWLRLSLALTLTAAMTACGGDDETPPAGQPAEQEAAAPAAVQPATPTPPPAAPVRRAPARPLVDEPWNPTDTGTVTPGMTREEVIAVWGPPVAERVAGSWTYLYFRNGCEASCGTFDLVFLDQGVVVDAITRGPGHTYAGVSSSPMGRAAAPTPPSGGMTLTVPADSTSSQIE